MNGLGLKEDISVKTQRGLGDDWKGSYCVTKAEVGMVVPIVVNLFVTVTGENSCGTIHSGRAVRLEGVTNPCFTGLLEDFRSDFLSVMFSL